MNGYGVTGNFKGATQSAVKAFQKDHGISQTGVVGEKTLNALIGSKTSTATLPTQPSSDSQRNLLKRWDSAEEVRKLQKMLLSKGYSLGGYNATGFYEPATEKAVKELQKDLKLPVTGTF